MEYTAVVLTCFGKPELTNAVVGDLLDDPQDAPFDIHVVDNKGDYSNDNPRVHVYQMTRNLGWLCGVNFGISITLDQGYDDIIFMDNDVRLSPKFVSNMIWTKNIYGKVVLAPSYDDVWQQQYLAGGSAGSYVPTSNVRRNVSFVDGTCQMFDADTFQLIAASGDGNWLDERYFTQHGWGADFDLGIRCKEAGVEIIVTEGSYLNHLRGATNKSIKKNYEEAASKEMNGGLNEKYGPDWHGRLT